MYYKKYKLVIITSLILIMIFSFFLTFISIKTPKGNGHEIFKEKTIKFHSFSENNPLSSKYESDTLFLLDYYIEDLNFENGIWYSDSPFIKTINIENYNSALKNSQYVENNEIVIENKFIIVNNDSFKETFHINNNLIVKKSIILFNDDCFFTSKNDLFMKNVITNANFISFNNLEIYNSSINLYYLSYFQSYSINNNFEIILNKNKLNYETGFYDNVWSYLTTI